MVMRVRVAALVAVGALLGAVGCAGTQEARQDISAMVPGVERNWKGIVTAVDLDANAVAVRPTDAAEQPAWFEISPTTEVVRNGEQVSIQEIEEGTPVSVAFEPAVGAERTFRVEVLTGTEAQEVLRQRR